MSDKDAADERKSLKDYLALIEKEAAANKQVKDAQKALEAKVAAKYRKLTEDEIKTLVVDDKWLATLAAAVQSELDRVSQALTGRIRQLAERYATPLPQAHRGSRNPRRPRGRTPQEDGGGMELKPGYKQTEVGVIPEEWELRPFGESVDVCSGGNARHRRAYVDGAGINAWTNRRAHIECSIPT